MSFEKYTTIYMIGIGGIGMSAIARYFHVHGKKVAGYDKTPTHLTDVLKEEGIEIHFEDNIEQAKRHSRLADETLVIYTPAVPQDHKELNYFQSSGYTVKKRSEVLADITARHFTIAVAGTHGKTTTASMIAHLLKNAGVNSLAFLGGITKNYHSNFISSLAEEKAIMVVEADEYDRSFLRLKPDIAVITSMDADHLDIYGSKEAMEESYLQFAGQVKPEGLLLMKEGLPSTDVSSRRKNYSLSGETDYRASSIMVRQHRFHFTWHNRTTTIDDLALQMPGRHNIENMVAAIAVARQVGIPSEKIREAVQSYQGVLRRFDYQVVRNDVVYIDDYAHHPEELRACISAVKELYPEKKITGIFQPHLFSRTKDFAEEFGKSLSLLDELLLLDIYPAREKPMEGVTSKIIFDRVNIPNKVMCRKESVMEELKQRKIEVLLTLGAGDIDQLVLPIKKYLGEKN